MPKEMADKGAKKWEICVAGFFLERRVPFLVVKRFADHMWASQGLIRITSNGQGMFILKFKSGNDLIKIIKEGPWVVGRQSFFMQK